MLSRILHPRRHVMSSTFKVGYFVGSLSSKSINRLLALALTKLAPQELEMREIPFKDLPLYSPDYETDYPPVARALKDAIEKSDAILFVTPEYNRSIPGGLKNAIDWASRPYGKNSFRRKPSAVIGTSPGAIGTAIAQQHLRSHITHSQQYLFAPINLASNKTMELGKRQDNQHKQITRLAPTNLCNPIIPLRQKQNKQPAH